MSEHVDLLVVGAGDRGYGYAGFARRMPERARIVGVAEPRDFHRERMAREFDIPPGNVFRDWAEAAARERLADAAIIATPDALHRAPAEAFAGKGYHLLLEKPMAPTEEECRAVAAAVERAGVMFAVAHVLRYTAYTTRLKAVLDAGRIGEVVSVQHLEPVGFWHQAHSFVRGNWRSEQASSFMLLAKSCHDLDWLQYVVGRPCRAVSSFGSLKHFHPGAKPEGAADRCLDCALEAQCPYSAPRIYFGMLAEGNRGWPVSVVAPAADEASLHEALRTGPYGRCVYACDNDVVDHQVVAMDFEGGASAVFTMTAFTAPGYGRTTRIFGTRGEILGDSRHIHVSDFLTGETEDIDTRAGDHSILGGHGGGDGGLIDAFVRAVATGDPSPIRSGVRETLASHRMVFAAERARREGRIVTLDDAP